jgi:thiol-disulfide isomerase/thioredoxin
MVYKNLYGMLCAMLVAFPAVTFGQIKVTGDIKNLHADTIILTYPSLQSKSEKVRIPVSDGKFEWSSDLTETTTVSLIMPVGASKMSFLLFAEPGEQKLSGDAASPATFKEIAVTGSKTQDEYLQYYTEMMDIYEKYRNAGQHLKTAPEEEKPEMKKQVETYYKQYYVTANDQYIEGHPESFFSLELLLNIANTGDYEKSKRLFEHLNPKLHSTVKGQFIEKQLAAIQNGFIGNKMIDFAFNDPAGKTIHLADYKGKYVLVDFWASWCGPCRAENPNILKAYQQFKDKNFTVLAISCDEKEERWLKALKEDHLPWTQVRGEGGKSFELMTHYGIKNIPSNFLVDPSGKIVAKDLRGDALAILLMEIMGK